MITLTVDGKEVQVPQGTRVIDAADKAGVQVPRYCYHPGLSVAGNCRMCMVEIEKSPKLQISCHIPATEGMVVHTQTPKVKQARAGVLEFLLINHPLDCPVCDQAGECDLQNFYMEHGLYDSKMHEAKLHKSKKAFSIGPTVMLDTERCILCSRCERFTDEVSKSHEFGIFNRGDHSEIGLYPGRQLDNPYSGNVVDICPVGALTDKDFRFKIRVWYLGQKESICPGCSRGCNIDIHFNKDDRPHHNEGKRVARLKPRHNPRVNQYWICDEGRYGYHALNDNRLTGVLRNEENKTAPATWQEALDAIVEALAADRRPGSIGLIGSAQLTNEDLYAMRTLFAGTLQGVMADWTGSPREGAEDDLLRKADKNPNTYGVNLLFDGMPRTPAREIVQAAQRGKVQVLYACQDLVADFGEKTVAQLRKAVKLFVYQGSNAGKTSEYAHWVLPSAAYAEKDGTFINFEGRIQRIFAALPPFGMALPDWEIFQRLAQGLGDVWGFAHARMLFQTMAKEVPGLRGLTWPAIGKQGLALKESCLSR